LFAVGLLLLIPLLARFIENIRQALLYP